MKTGIVLAGVVALASAAPAAKETDFKLGESTALASAAFAAKETDFMIGCEGETCSYYTKGGPPKYESTKPVYGASTTSYGPPHGKPSPYAPPHHSSTKPEYKASTTPYHPPKGKPSTYAPPHHSSTKPEYKASTTPYAPPHHSSTQPEYKASTPYSPPHGKPSPYGPPHGYTSSSPYEPPTSTWPAYKPTSAPMYGPDIDWDEEHGHIRRSVYPTPPPAPYGGKPQGSGKPEHPHGPQGGKPHGGKPLKPTSPPFCDFVEAECIDCNEHPEDCDTCNFIFKCGSKKQCTYLGFRETMTLCKEVGEECPWKYYSDDEYDAPGKPEHPQGPGGKPEHPQGPGGKPEYPHPQGPADKPDYTKPEGPHGGEKPKGPGGKPDYNKPAGPNGGKPDHNKPAGPNGGKPGKPEHPESPYDKPQYNPPTGPYGGQPPKPYSAPMTSTGYSAPTTSTGYPAPKPTYGPGGKANQARAVPVDTPECAIAKAIEKLVCQPESIDPTLCSDFQVIVEDACSTKKANQARAVDDAGITCDALDRMWDGLKCGTPEIQYPDKDIDEVIYVVCDTLDNAWRSLDC